MYKPRDIIQLIADNVKKTRNPFGAPNFLINRWWKTFQLPTAGEGLLFTGLMYQSVPYIEMTTTHLERYEDSALAGYIRYGKYVPKFFLGLGLSLLSSKEEKENSSETLQSIAKILSRSEVDFY